MSLNPADPYQAGHLQVFFPLALETAVRPHGYTVLHYEEWEWGQVWVLHLTDKP